MLDQQTFNIAISIAGGLGGWWMKAIWDALKDLQRQDHLLVSEISDLKVLVAGQYVKSEVFDKTITAMFAKLDRIEDKLSSKADKVGISDR